MTYLTKEQKTALKSAVMADPAMSSLDFNDPNNDQVVANYLNALATNSASAPYKVWRMSVPVSEVFNAVTWKNLTPADAPDGTQLWMNRCLMCQCMQMNLQILLQGRMLPVTGADANFTQVLKDALSQVPSGPGGSSVDAGWVNVRNTLQRTCTVAEKVLLAAANAGTVAGPGVLGWEGTLDALMAAT